MPNWVTNEILIEGPSNRIKEVLEFVKDDRMGPGSIDFNKITPMPKWVYGNQPEVSGISSNDTIALGESNTYIGFAIENWGTKWNADNNFAFLDDTSNVLLFTTAWSNVRGLIHKLSCIFPDLTFQYRYADEDYGCNVGSLTFKCGELLASETPPENSKEAQELALDILGINIDENAVWSDEEGGYVLVFD